MRTLTDMMKKIGLLALSLLVFSPAMAQSAPQAEDPVSYTHLDVYKRQGTSIQ